MLVADHSWSPIAGWHFFARPDGQSPFLSEVTRWSFAAQGAMRERMKRCAAGNFAVAEWHRPLGRMAALFVPLDDDVFGVLYAPTKGGKDGFVALCAFKGRRGAIPVMSWIRSRVRLTLYLTDR